MSWNSGVEEEEKLEEEEENKKEEGGEGLSSFVYNTSRIFFPFFCSLLLLKWFPSVDVDKSLVTE